MFQLLGCYQYGVDQLLNLWVPSLGLIEYLTNEIDWSLYLVDVVGLRLTTMAVETTRLVAAMYR